VGDSPAVVRRVRLQAGYPRGGMEMDLEEELEMPTASLRDELTHGSGV
jgi:hypothetical protein